MFERYLHQPWLALCFDESGDGGGGDVTNIDVPAPGADDIEILSGDDDEEDEPEENDEPEEDEDEDTPDPEKKVVKKEKTTPKKEKEVEIALEDDDEDDEEKPKAKEKEDDEEEEDKEPRNVTFKAIKDKYPQIYKEFPDLRRVMGEHSKYRSLFSSTADAEEAVQNSVAFDALRDSIMGGDFETLAKEISTADKEALPRLARNILPTLRKMDSDVYFEVVGPVLKELVHAAYQSGVAGGTDKAKINLKNSAHFMWDFLGLKGEPRLEENKPHPEEERLKRDRQEFERSKLGEAQGSVNTVIIDKMDKAIRMAVDPDNSMKPGVVKALIKDIRDEIDADLVKDTNHMSRIKRLWAQANRSSYSRAHLSSITDAYLERGKALIPKKVMEVTGEKPKNKKVNGSKLPARPSSGGVSNPKSFRETNPRKIDWNKTSDMDILSGKAKLK